MTTILRFLLLATFVLSCLSAPRWQLIEIEDSGEEEAGLENEDVEINQEDGSDADATASADAADGAEEVANQTLPDEDGEGDDAVAEEGTDGVADDAGGDGEGDDAVAEEGADGAGDAAGGDEPETGAGRVRCPSGRRGRKCRSFRRPKVGRGFVV